MNSTVGLIFNEKIAEKCNLWVREECTYTLFTVKSQHLQLQCMNSNHITPKHVKKKEREKERKRTASVESKHTLNV